jgi:preprotein translocase subunit SecE
MSMFRGVCPGTNEAEDKMATEQDEKKDEREEELPQDEPAEQGHADASIEPAADEEVHDVALVGAASPQQLGTKRFVYAAYFSGAIAIAFLMSKVIEIAWHRLQTWKPGLPDPDANEPSIMLASALIGAGAAAYYWYRTRARQLAEEVATEMSKVTWPSRTEVTNGTFVVIVTTVVSTVFFALMDRFWGFLTNLVYGGS